MYHATLLLDWQSIYRSDGITDQCKWSVGGKFYQISGEYVRKNGAGRPDTKHTPKQLRKGDKCCGMGEIFLLHIRLHGNNGILLKRYVKSYKHKYDDDAKLPA